MGAGWEIYPAGYLLWGVAVLVLLGLIYAALHHIAKRLDEAAAQAARDQSAALASKAEPMAFGRMTPEQAAESRRRRREDKP